MTFNRISRCLALAALVILGIAGRADAASNPYTIAASPTFPISAPYPLAGYSNIQWLAGANGNGSADNCAVFQAAATYAGSHPGTWYLLPSGTYAIASATCTTILWPHDTVLAGQGPDKTQIKLTGSGTLQPIFLAANQTNVYFKDLGIYGNSHGTSGGIGAIEFIAASTVTPISNFGLINVTLSNFQSALWVEAINDGTVPATVGRFSNVRCMSFSGNMLDPTNINSNAVCLAFIGEYEHLGAYLNDMLVDGMYADCTWIKNAVGFYSGVSGATVRNSRVENCGTNASDNAGGYGLFAYRLDPFHISAIPPTNISWINNQIINARSNGVYVAETNGCVISGNFISGQSDATTANPAIKGAIGLGAVQNCTITGNVLTNNYSSIVIAGEGTTSNIAADNVIASNVTNGLGITVKPLGTPIASTDATQTFLNNNTVRMTGTGSTALVISSSRGSSLTPGYVQVNGGRYEATSVDIQTVDATTGGGVVSIGVDIGGNVVLAGAPLIALQHINTATPITLDGVIVDAVAAPGAGSGIVLTNATDINIEGLLIKNKPSGAGTMLSVSGANGTMPMGAVQWDNVGSAQRYTSADFGITSPGWTGSIGDQVVALNPTEAGSAASKYIVQSWIYGSTGAWFAQRTLTGN